MGEMSFDCVDHIIILGMLKMFGLGRAVRSFCIIYFIHDERIRLYYLLWMLAPLSRIPFLYIFHS